MRVKQVVVVLCWDVIFYALVLTNKKEPYQNMLE